MNKIISLKNIKKIYGNKVVLDNFNLDIYKGERIAFLGGNGSGKSTTVELIAKIKQPTSGEVWWSDDVKIGIQFQESKYPLGITTKMLIDFYLDSYGRENVDDKYIEKMINMFRLKELENKQIYELSGGQQQRINILLSLIHKPNFLILDELSTGLDIQIRREIRQYVLDYLDENPECSLILITHNVSEALKMCNKIIILNKGEIFINDKIDNLIQKHGDLNNFIDDFFKKIYFEKQSETTIKEKKWSFFKRKDKKNESSF
ncbi:ABC transporter ATP-binding protein [Mesomycoplasma molare]|uniref:ABC transporter ATP-binding protein n=1 Tax=Mesomycoplasma molare TaxID=171288 RepID=UPI000687D200|nr:ABC transporter ATP-binding protein [Mesomycoplasma molare]